jgi:hypothetical protein
MYEEEMWRFPFKDESQWISRTMISLTQKISSRFSIFDDRVQHRVFRRNGDSVTLPEHHALVCDGWRRRDGD